MERIEHRACADGWQDVYRHRSEVLQCDMNFAVFLPEQIQDKPLPVLYWLSGLTCTEQNFITKAGAQRYASEHGVVIVAPDTSPRGNDVPDDAEYDLGKGAGFYVNATVAPWDTHFRMYDYVVKELPALIEANFNVTSARSISGHSMGGHGALVIGLRNPDRYKSISAFSPVVAPSQVPWGRKAFGAYLGHDEATWAEYDAVEIVKNGVVARPILIDQGGADDFLENQLKPALFEDACRRSGVPLQLNMRDGYDHSYYFMASFIGEHIRFHADALSR